MGCDRHYMRDINDRLLFLSMLRAGCACRKQCPNDLGGIMTRSGNRLDKKLQVTRVEREFFIRRNVRQKNCLRMGFVWRRRTTNRTKSLNLYANFSNFFNLSFDCFDEFLNDRRCRKHILQIIFLQIWVTPVNQRYLFCFDGPY
jgi:hypothetical protein